MESEPCSDCEHCESGFYCNCEQPCSGLNGWPKFKKIVTIEEQKRTGEGIKEKGPSICIKCLNLEIEEQTSDYPGSCGCRAREDGPSNRTRCKDFIPGGPSRPRMWKGGYMDADEARK